jgi:hypothetical protein
MGQVPCLEYYEQGVQMQLLWFDMRAEDQSYYLTVALSLPSPQGK